MSTHTFDGWTLRCLVGRLRTIALRTEKIVRVRLQDLLHDAADWCAPNGRLCDEAHKRAGELLRRRRALAHALEESDSLSFNELIQKVADLRLRQGCLF